MRCWRRLTKLSKRVKIARRKAEGLQSELDELKSKSNVSSANEYEMNHAEQTSFIFEQAQQLSFGDEAKDAVTAEIAKLKKKFSGRPSAFFTSDEYADLQKQRKRIEDERSHIELELQSYFDHFAHGASKTETAQPESADKTDQ